MKATTRVAVVTVLGVMVGAGVGRIVLGPVYRMHDGCKCGQERTWLSFDEFAPLRRTPFAIEISAGGDPRHAHQYWDATWSGQFWFREGSRETAAR